VGGHPSYLAVAAFLDGELKPAGRNILAISHGGLALPDGGLGHDAGFGWQGFAIVEENALAQALQSGVIDFTLHLCPIYLGHFMQWMGDLVLQAAVVGQQQQAFRIIVEAAGGIDSRLMDKFLESGSAFLIGELAKH